MKKISLITTTKDRPDMILDAALSVECQTIKPHEWIILIDGDDRPYGKAIEKLQKIPFVKIFAGGGNLGRGYALRLAHNYATGDYIGWLDDDDWLDHTCLEKFSNAPDVSFLYCNYYQVMSDRLLIPPASNKPYDYELYLRTGCIVHFVLYTKQLYEQVGGIDSSVVACCDMDLYAKMLKDLDKSQVYKIDELLYYYRYHRNRMSTVLRREQRAQFKLIQEKYKVNHG